MKHRVVDTAMFPEPPILVNAFRSAMSLLAGGVTIVTSGQGDGRRGLTATAVCSLSMAPPMILACINNTGEAHAAIEREANFAVNILAEESREISDLFAGRGAERGAAKFEVAEWMTLKTGAPVLKEALVAVDCEVAEKICLPTHTVFLGAVRDVLIGPGKAPLLHYDRHYGSVIVR